MVVVLYYDYGMNLREIGETLNVSESRVCQIHSSEPLADYAPRCVTA